jgi:hypothetical protein
MQLPPIPPRDADANTTWGFLKIGIQSIMTNEKLSYQQHNTLTSVVHDFMTSTRTSGTENTQDARAGKRPASEHNPPC